ncbi:hypothetical protein BOX15_Mlig026916g1 [Macrostomum lignano]|uniref:C2H2-type domain-containing protein n=3 Tax=Macrostomum lignano TaxID=282301 RepID=A0A267EZA3_9PLAT|nr:hypothetical protein BOX15_Mlig026916g1 [Macrostomum lignano]
MLPFSRMNGTGDKNSKDNHTISDSSSSFMELTVSKLRKQRAALLDKDSQHAKYEQLAHRLESASACCVCGFCLAYSSWDPSQLGKHAAAEHNAVESVCPYCLTQVPAADIGEHQLRHFSAATAQDLYPCPHCSAYLEDKTAFLDHCHGLHSGRMEDCACGCCGQVFGSAVQLAAHLEESVRPLYHCEVPGCLVKSASKLAVQRHLAKRHPSQPATAIASIDYLACAARPVSYLSLPPLADPPSASLTVKSDAADPEKPAGPPVFGLRCPACQFATVDWGKFLRHLCSDCRGSGFARQSDDAGEAGASVVAYTLCHCSECGAAATDAALILEHIASAHPDSPEATLLQEDIRTSRVMLAKTLVEELPPPPPPPPQPQPQQQQQLLQLVRKRPLDEQPSSALASLISASPAAANAAAAGPATADGTKVPRLDVSSETTEYVSFPFHEEAYRAARPATAATETLIAKMKLFCGYRVKILGRENQRRIPECPECKRAFPYGLGDFKRHLLSVHLGIPRDTVRDCLKFTQPVPGSNKAGAITLVRKSEPENERSLPRPVRIDAFRHRVPLPYSTAVLRQLTQHFSRESQEYLIAKMATYSTLYVIVDARNGKKYLCGSCNYASPHALADVRKHILGAHCGISTKHFRYCLQASRLDPAEYTLLSDDKLIRLAREFVRVRQSDPRAAGSSEDAEDVMMLDPDAAAVLEPPSSLSQQLKPPSTPSSVDGVPAAGSAVTASSSTGFTDTAGKGAMLHFGQNPSHFEEADGVDEEEVINLPFSEAVLRHLLRDASDRPHQDSLVAKMRAYSKYQLVRQIARGKTVAYKCICGRVFHTVRRPGNSVRPSTLADARRHVMGVHARISHEMLTTCCQASRISRENNWHLYADEMLLRLANERPAKASTNFASAPRSLDDSALSNQNSRLDESGCGPGEDSCSMLTGESQQRGDDAGKKQQQPEFSSLLYSSHPVWPGETGKLLKSSSSAALGLIADSEHRAAASSPTASPAGASSAGGLSTSTPTMLGGGLGRSEPPIQPHEVATQEQRLASLRVLEEEGELERAVELPYSFSALQVLIEGACDSETMEILREKMEYYSTYKVAVTRTVSDNKRVFRCSGCSASSPHGMGDIRKHILGVHAKVPDRFKTACLHASRLSRDDNRLLPDPLLIQLARLKWKGTVGPNEEKLGRGGAATEALSAVSSAAAVSAAAAASTASYDAAFPSMVPLRPARAASSGTPAASVSPASATGSIAASPNKGLRIKIKTTGAGSDQELVTSVASADEPGEDAEDSTSSSAGVPPEMQCSSDRPQIPTTCFVIQADESEKPLPPGRCQFTCSWCEFGSHNVGPVRGHIVRDHLRIPGHKCSVCGKLYAVRNHVFRHHLLEHPQREFHLLQYSAYRYAMNRVDVKPSSQAKRILQRSAAAIAAAKTRREAAAAAAAAAASAAASASGNSSSGSRKRPRSMSEEEDQEQDDEEEDYEDGADNGVNDEEAGEAGDDEEGNEEEADEEDYADDAEMQIIEDDGAEEDGEDGEAEEEAGDEEGEDEEEEEAETEAQEDDEEQDDEEEGAETAAAQPASVMVNGKELLLMPDSLDRAVDPAPLAKCWVVRKRGNFGGVTYHCSVCTSSSSSLNSLKDHIVQYHLGVFPHHCHLCRRSYWSREVLDTHFTEAHPGDRPKTRPPQAYRDAIQGLPIRAPGGK